MVKEIVETVEIVKENSDGNREICWQFRPRECLSGIGSCRVLGERVGDRNCRVHVYKIKPASHTVCRYEFPEQGFSVVAKFYAEPTGWMRDYDPFRALENEFNTLKQVESIVDIPRPLAIHRDFHCALLTEYIRGKSFYEYMSDIKKEGRLYDKLTSIADLQRRLHDRTKSEYRKDWVFARFHSVLDQLMLDAKTRDGIQPPAGCMVVQPAAGLAVRLQDSRRS